LISFGILSENWDDGVGVVGWRFVIVLLTLHRFLFLPLGNLVIVAGESIAHLVSFTC
jgi:hypothetical protein